MIRQYWALTLSTLLTVSGCASLDGTAESDPSDTPQITYAQLKTSTETYKGQAVTLGGKVLSAKRLKDGTRIEILQLPLISILKPTLDLSKSQGRFVAIKREFLDPATLPFGTFVTITGEVAGSMTLPLDETEYTYPVVHIKNVRVWQRRRMKTGRPAFDRTWVPAPFGAPTGLHIRDPGHTGSAPSLVKRISSFDFAQDGEPVEPYLATKDERRSLSVLRFTLHEIRFTRTAIHPH